MGGANSGREANIFLGVLLIQPSLPTHLLCVAGIIRCKSDLADDGAIAWVVIEHHHAVG